MASYSPRPPSSITRTGAFEPFELQVARGQIPWHESKAVFGYNGDVDTAVETVWPNGGILQFTAAPLQLSVSSNNANDTSNGTGARTIYLEGLDANHNSISETVSLTGQTAVTTTKSYLHINNCYVATAGSLNSAAGTIYFGTGTVTTGVPATIYDVIEYDYNARITGSYTVPAGYTAYITQGLFSSGQSSGTGPVTGRLMTRGTDNIRRTAAVTTVNNNAADYLFEYPLAVPEKTTIEAQAVGTGNNNTCSSMFILVLVKNDAGTS
jgi:hypothetical protein